MQPEPSTGFALARAPGIFPLAAGHGSFLANLQMAGSSSCGRCQGSGHPIDLNISSSLCLTCWYERSTHIPMQAYRSLGVNVSILFTADKVAVLRMYEEVDATTQTDSDAQSQPMLLKYCAETDDCWQVPWCAKKARTLVFEFFDLSDQALNIAAKEVIFQCGGESPECPMIDFTSLEPYVGNVRVEDADIRHTTVFHFPFYCPILRNRPPDGKHPLEASVLFRSSTTGLLLSNKFLKIVKGKAGRCRQEQKHGSHLTCILPHSVDSLPHITRLATQYGCPVEYIAWLIINYASRAVGFGFLKMIDMESNICHPMISMLGNRWVAQRYRQKLTEYKNTTLINQYICLYQMSNFEAAIAGLQEIHELMEIRPCAGWLRATFALVSARWSQLLIRLQCPSLGPREEICATLRNEAARSVSALEAAFSSTCNVQKQCGLIGYVELCDIVNHWPVLWEIPKDLDVRIQKLRAIVDRQLQSFSPKYSTFIKIVRCQLEIASVLGNPRDSAIMERCHARIQDCEKERDLQPCLRARLRESMAKHVIELHMNTKDQPRFADLQDITNLALNPSLACDVPLVVHLFCQLSKWSLSRPLAGEYAEYLVQVKDTPGYESWKGTENLMDPWHHEPCSCLGEQAASATASHSSSCVPPSAKRGSNPGEHSSKTRKVTVQGQLQDEWTAPPPFAQ